MAQQPPPATDASVHAEQIRTLYRQRLAVIAVNPLNAAIVAAVIWPYSDHRGLVAWVTAMIVAVVLRLELRRRFYSVPRSIDDHLVWGRRLVWSAFGIGLLWGIGGAAFYDPVIVVPQLLLIFVIGGMVAGASGTLAFHLPAFVAFSSAAIVPLAMRLLAVGDRAHVAMGVLTIVYGLAMSMITAHSNRAISESFRLRFENQDLLSKLSAAQVSLAETNQTLEQRVAERGAALERQTEALRDAQRMESVGLLAGGIAHDFNNLLTVVLGNVELLMTSSEPREHGHLEEIQSAANRGAALVSQLLAFSRRQVMVRRVLDVNDVIADVRPLLTRLIGEHIDLKVATSATPLTVRADPTQLQQTIINLATNARDAMAGGGTLTIETQVFDEAPVGTTLPDGRYVALAVRDTGVGMDDTTRRMAFHPFFTTKEVGKGTGLGLATVHGIVEQSGGHVLVESAPGKGSCFRVFLPWVAVEKSEVTTAPAQNTPLGVPVPATILIAEDEALVRAVTARVLTKAGYTVIEANDGEQALQVVQRHETPFDLVISDVVMAKLGGLELAKRLTAHYPGMPILLVSGYSTEEMTDDPARTISFLQKPFTPSELLEKVSTLLTVSGRHLT